MTPKGAKARLLKYALARPGATLHHPWGENVAKVQGKVFVFFGMADTPADSPYADYVMGVKLTNALLFAKSQSFVEPMGYGLGKSGWVSVKMPKGAAPMDMFEEWIDESYYAVAKPHGKEPAKAKAEPYENVAPKRSSRAAAAPRGVAARAAPSRTSTRRAARSLPGRARPTRS